MATTVKWADGGAILADSTVRWSDGGVYQFYYTPPAGGVVSRILISSAWKTANVQIKVGGAWKTVAASKVFVGGEWK